MTDQPATPTNTAIIVGQLGTILEYVRDGKRFERVEKVVVPRYNSMRGEWLQFTLLMESPLGEPFVCRMEVASTTPGAELLHTKQAGERIAIEGFPQIETTRDRRYALSDEDEGRNVRDMQMNVTLVREPREDEPQHASAVWLEGKVIEPPRFIRHPEIRSLQLATTLLEVFVTREMPYRPGYPGLRRMYRDRIEVPIAISVDHEHAEWLYRAGNSVRLDGEITQVMLEQYGGQVEAAVDAVKEEWTTAKEELASKSRQEQQKGLRRFRKQVSSLSEQARSMIMVGFVEPLDGAEKMTFSQARDSRREFLDKRRKRGNGAATAMIQQPKALSEAAPKVDAPRPRRKSDAPPAASVDMTLLVAAPVEVEAMTNGVAGD